MRSLLALLAGLALGVAFTGYSADQARGDLALERARTSQAESKVGPPASPSTRSTASSTTALPSSARRSPSP